MHTGTESESENSFLSEKFYQVEQREINPLQKHTNWCFRHTGEESLEKWPLNSQLRILTKTEGQSVSACC